jgi:hypothetical protein
MIPAFFISLLTCFRLFLDELKVLEHLEALRRCAKQGWARQYSALHAFHSHAFAWLSTCSANGGLVAAMCRRCRLPAESQVLLPGEGRLGRGAGAALERAR